MIKGGSKILACTSEWNPQLGLSQVDVWGSSLQTEGNWKGSFRLTDTVNKPREESEEATDWWISKPEGSSHILQIYDYSGLMRCFHRFTGYFKVLLPAFGTVLLTNLNKEILSWNLISTCTFRLYLNDVPPPHQESEISSAKELQACYNAAGLTRLKSSKRKESGKSCWKKMLQEERKSDPKPNNPKIPPTTTSSCHSEILQPMYLSQFGLLGAKCWSLYPAPGSGFAEHHIARLALMLVFKSDWVTL